VIEPQLIRIEGSDGSVIREAPDLQTMVSVRVAKGSFAAVVSEAP
jgi:hypothetical protein